MKGCIKKLFRKIEIGNDFWIKNQGGDHTLCVKTSDNTAEFTFNENQKETFKLPPNKFVWVDNTNPALPKQQNGKG